MNETLIIMMRDGGFECFYENQYYQMKGGEVEKVIPRKANTRPPVTPNSTKVLSALKELRDSFTEEERKTLFED
jgi:hypothetical protein